VRAARPGAHEAFGVGFEGVVERDLAGCMDFIGLSIMNLIRRHQAEADMVMRLIIPHEEHAAELPGVLDTAETTREGWLVLQSLEVAFRERVVVGCVRSAMRFGDAGSASRNAVALAFIGPPRSACRVSCPHSRARSPGITGCLTMVSSNKALNRAALSASATHQPTTRRLKMSMMTYR
jgi:hypothetical protein